MRFACSLTNGDGFTFNYATIDITPDYAARLFELVAEAATLKRAHDTFYAVELFDHAVEYGSALGEFETLESFDSDRQWVQVPDNHQWPDDCQQSVSAATVVVTADSLHWRAAAKHGDDGTYFETPPLTVAELREMLPPENVQETQDSPEPLPPSLPHAKHYIDAGGGFCPSCRSDQIEGNSVDIDGRHCTQRMDCLDCDTVWFDAYTLSSIEPRD